MQQQPAALQTHGQGAEGKGHEKGYEKKNAFHATNL